MNSEVSKSRRVVWLTPWLSVLMACSSMNGTPQDADAGGLLDAQSLDVVDDLPQAPLPVVHGLSELPDQSPDPRVVEVDLTAASGEAMYVQDRWTRILAYNNSSPGPLLHARVGDRVIVHFRNNMPDDTTVHWHGLRISDQMDGSPRIQAPVPAHGSFTYDFVVPEPGTFWYHSHVSSIEQIDRGLYGAIVVHEASPPRFNAERIFVLDDVRLDANYQIGRFLTSGPDVGRGRTGNYLLTNGTAGTYALTVPRGGVERWRIINTANARTMSLAVLGANIRVIATDGGFLPTPYAPDRLEIAPGQRLELEVRVSDPDAEHVELLSFVLVQRSDGTIGEEAIPIVDATIEGSVDPVEPTYPTVRLPETSVPAEERQLLLSGGVVDGGVEFTINGVAGHGHDHPVTERVMQGMPQRWTITSQVSPEHPFHLHGQFFQIVERGGVPVTDEPGLRDTVLVRGNEPVTILTYFENPGRWMYHCHISEHSERGMMAEIQVTPNP